MRLTNAIRETIVQKETSKKFYDKILKVENQLDDLLEKEAEKIIKSMPYKIPQKMIDDKYVNTCNYIQFENLKDKDGWRISFKLRNQYPCSRFSDTLKCKIAPKSLINKKEKLEQLKSDRQKFRKYLSSILSVFTSSKPLVEQMPELEIYFQGAEKQKTMALIPVDQINAIRTQLVRP